MVAATALVAAVAWGTIAGLLAPHLIREGYAARSLAVVNQVFAGRDVHPVEFYLDAWRSLALMVTVGLAGAFVVAAWWSMVPRARRAFVRKMIGTGAGLDAGSLLRLGLWVGLLGGAAEAGYQAIRQVVTNRPALLFHSEILWMAPLGSALAMGTVAAFVALLARGAGGRIGLFQSILALASIAIYGVLQAPGIRLHPLAAAVLGLGLGSALARAASSRPGLVLRMARRSGASLALALLALAVTGYASRPALVEARALRDAPAPTGALPNVLLLILDTARAANFGLYGYDRPTSPNIDRWARHGVIFDRAVATSSWTLPSHGGMFTGAHNHTLGTGFAQPLEERFVTLAEVLAERGYSTGGFVANPVYATSASGLGQGFARYEDRPVDVANFIGSSWLSRTVLGPVIYRLTGDGPHIKTADELTRELFSWLDRVDEGRPFFAFLNFIEAHEPYTAPDSMVERFGPRPTTDWATFAGSFRTSEGEPVDDHEIERWINRYDAGIAYIDFQVGRIRERLARAGLLESTIVIIASDHGEMWGEQREIGHASSLYFPALHVPLVVIYPGAVPQGVRVAEPVSVRDVARTVLDLAGIPEPRRFGGSSLTASFDSVPEPSEPQLSELEPYGFGVPWWAPVNDGAIKSLVSDDLQYIRYADGHEELFDLERDPVQRTNLARGGATDALLRVRHLLDSIVAADTD